MLSTELEFEDQLLAGPAIPALGRQKQEDCEFKANLSSFGVFNANLGS